MPDDKTETAATETKPSGEAKGTTEAKPAEGATQTKPETTPETKPDEKKADAPVEYKLKLPDGSLLDEKHVAKTLAYAKEKKLAPEVAQMLLDRESAAAAGHWDSVLARHADVVKEWAKESEQHFGAKWKETQELAYRGREWLTKKAGLTDEEVNEFFSDKGAGYGNQRAVVSMLAVIGRELRDDRLVTGGQPGAKPKSALEKLYPGMDPVTGKYAGKFNTPAEAAAEGG